MRKNTLYILSLLVSFCFINGLANDVVIHSSTGNGLNQIYLDPPYVTYDDDLNELYVYFGTTGTIDLECDDGTGTQLTAACSRAEPKSRLRLEMLR